MRLKATRRAACVTVALATALLGASQVPATSAAASSSGNTEVSATDWTRYVQAPKSSFVEATRVVRTSGHVRTPGNLVAGHAGGATLIMRPGQARPAVVLDLGQVVGGIPHIVVSGVDGSPRLRASFSESRRFIDADGDNGGQGPCCGNAPPAAEPLRYNEWEPTHPAVLRTTYQQGGERFVRLALNKPGSVTIRRAGIEFKAFRAQPSAYQGWFLSDDDLVNRVWYASAYTDQLDMVPVGAQNDNPDPAIVDGAKRDRLSWSGDTVVQGPAIWNHLGTNGAPYIRATLMQYADRASPSGALATTVGVNTDTTLYFSASYSMDAANAMVDYYRYTGESDFAATVLPAVRNQLSFDESLLDDRGLIETGPPGSRPDVGFPPLCCGLDWDPYDGPKTGAVAAYNVIYYHTLLETAYLEEHAGDAAAAGDLRQRAEQLRALILATFYDPERGLLVVSESNSGVAEDANALAVLYGVVHGDQAQSILDHLRTTLWSQYGSKPFSDDAGFNATLSPYINGLEIQARLSAGDGTHALDLLRRHDGQMIKPGADYSGALWEKMAPDGSADEVSDPTLPVDGNSLAHGWATSPLTALSQSVLGVTPVEPGYSTFQVAPEPSGLHWAQGQVPTPYGAVRVSWRETRPGSFTLEVSAPSGISGVIRVPAQGVWHVSYDGRAVSPGPARAVSVGG